MKKETVPALGHDLYTVEGTYKSGEKILGYRDVCNACGKDVTDSAVRKAHVIETKGLHGGYHEEAITEPIYSTAKTYKCRRCSYAADASWHER